MIIISPIVFVVLGMTPLERGTNALKQMTGCYLVDYSYVETDSLKSGYVRRKEVYDVNIKNSAKEWIYSEKLSPTRIRLQHILFSASPEGEALKDSVIRHQVEDWEYGAPYLYDYKGERKWIVKDLKSTPDLWTRRITHLDDGLRYQCAAEWKATTGYPDWSCKNYSPIPGRETRDMKRKDYHGMQRTTRLVLYGSSWLERQNNTKVIERKGKQSNLAKEIGKTWYIRLPDSECQVGKDFAEPRKAFWNVLREVWDEVLSGKTDFMERAVKGPPRWAKMNEVEDKYISRDLDDTQVRKEAKDQILKVISDYRLN